MPFLDGKGRIFGLINVIDLVTLLVAVSLVAGAGYKVFDPRATAPYKTVRFEFSDPVVQPQVARAVKVGDLLTSVSSTGSALALIGGSPFDRPVKVTSVRVSHALIDVTTAAGTRVLSPDPYLKEVTVWCRGKTPVTGGSIDLAGAQIRAGTDLTLASANVQLNGYVLRVKIA